MGGKRLVKTDNMKKAIDTFGQLTFEQGKYFLPPYTKAGMDPVKATADDAEKIMKWLSWENVVRIRGEVAYKFITAKRTPTVFNQQIIDCIWVMLHYTYNNGETRQPWELLDSVIMHEGGCVKMSFIVNKQYLVNVIPISSKFDADNIYLEEKEYQASECKSTTRYLVVTRDKKLLLDARNAKVTFPIQYIVLTGEGLEEEVHEPVKINYLKVNEESKKMS